MGNLLDPSQLAQPIAKSILSDVSDTLPPAEVRGPISLAPTILFDQTLPPIKNDTFDMVRSGMDSFVTRALPIMKLAASRVLQMSGQSLTWMNERLLIDKNRYARNLVERLRTGQVSRQDEKIIADVALGRQSRLLGYFSLADLPYVVEKFMAQDVPMMGYFVAKLTSHNAKSDLGIGAVDSLAEEAQKLFENPGQDQFDQKVRAIARVLGHIARETKDEALAAKAIGHLIALVKRHSDSGSHLSGLMTLNFHKFREDHLLELLDAAKGSREVASSLSWFFERRPDLLYVSQSGWGYSYQVHQEAVAGLIELARMGRDSRPLISIAFRQKEFRIKSGRPDLPELLANFIPDLIALSVEKPGNATLKYMAIYSENETTRQEAFLGMIRALAFVWRETGPDSKATLERKAQLSRLVKDRPEYGAALKSLARSLLDLAKEENAEQIAPLLRHVQNGTFQDWLAA